MKALRVDKVRQQILDRQAYRETLIQRRNGIDEKLTATEDQIKKLRELGSVYVSGRVA